MVGERECACYTLGYNLSVFSHRVHDVLTATIAAAALTGRPVRLLGRGPTAGPVCAAAAALCATSPMVLAATAIGTAGFRFGAITAIDDLGAWSNTPIRDTSCCYHPLNDVPCLRLGPHRAAARRGQVRRSPSAARADRTGVAPHR